jgi:hypothetical protein
VTTAELIRDKVAETGVPTTGSDWTLIGSNYYRNGSLNLMNEYHLTLAAEDCDGSSTATATGTAPVNATTAGTGSSGGVATDAYGVDSNAYWSACSASGNN